MLTPSRSRFYLKSHLRLTSACFPVLFMGAAIGFFGCSYILPTLPPQPGILGYFESAIDLLAKVFFLLMTVVTIFTNTLPTFVSRLDVSDAGLEYLYWPTYHIRCTWKDIETITKRREVVTADVILLRQATELGWPITMKLRKALGRSTQHFIPLNILEGWPEGKLAEQLRHHAPHLFS